MNRQHERATQRGLLWGMFLIGLAFAVFFGLGHYFLTLLFLGLACFSLFGMMSTMKPRKIFGGLQELVWYLGLAILFLPQIAFWPWGVGGFLIICGASAIVGTLAQQIIAGIKGMGVASQANPQPQPIDQPPSHLYEQGYQPLEQAPQAYQEGGEVYSQPPQPGPQSPYEQAQVQYPQQEETPLQQRSPV